MKDGTVDPASVEVLLQKSGSSACEAHYLPRSQHILGLDLERDVVCDRALRFVEDTAPKRAPGDQGGTA